MLQALIKKGKVTAENVPHPAVFKKSVLIKVAYSCISTGTELSGIQSSGQSLIKKALKQPEKVKQALNMVSQSSVISTIKKIKGKLDAAQSIGYSVSGIVVGVGTGTSKFQIGDKVAAGGAGKANHAEFVDVPENLVVKIPKNLELKEAATITLGSIALQGVRRAQLQLGEYAAVIGTGLLGLLTIQLLKISGIRVIAIDIDENRLKKARTLGADKCIISTKDNILKEVELFTEKKGVDTALITASTQSSAPLSQAFNICKKKGRVVLVGATGMEINREDMYEKELDFLISMSYGPGRYDKIYEEEGHDYPYSYVRWTENRNMQEYLKLLAEKKIAVNELIEGEFPIQKVDKAYERLEKASSKPLIALINYGNITKKDFCLSSPKISISIRKSSNNKINIGIIGAGSFAQGIHLPNLAKLHKQFHIHSIATSKGNIATETAKKYKASIATTDYKDILKDKQIDLVFICTRHDSHASLILEALKAGKHVFVEKPLAIHQKELDKIKEFYHKTKNPPLLMVGFNRRFSPYTKEIKKHTDKRLNPLFIRYRMNAGTLPDNHWIFKQGGRIIGEACHIIDLMTFFTGSKIISIFSESLTPNSNTFSHADNKSINLKYADGSLATIDYFASGSQKLAKEYMEIHFDEKSIILDNYESLTGYGLKIKERKSKIPQKGHLEELENLYQSLKEKKDSWPIDLSEMIETTESTFQI